MGYVPPKEILERYAQLTVQFGLGDGKGIQPGETVLLYAQTASRPLYYEICCEIWRRGAHVLHGLTHEDDGDYNFSAAYYNIASEEQIGSFMESYQRGLWEQSDHMIVIDGSRNPTATRGVDPAKQAAKGPRIAKILELRLPKERAGLLDWTIVLWGTEEQAAEAGLSIEEYWGEIIAACYLDDPDPVQRCLDLLKEIHRYRDWLQSLPIDRLHVEAEGTDLWLTLGEHRQWIGGGGANIPSFEIFTTPDWRGTNGTIRFTEPLYHQGSLLRGVELEFKDGLVVRADAEEGAEQVAAMVGMPGGNKVGEFSMTDSRLSRITKFMASTLYDENVGGRYGNTHLAIGMGLTICYDGDEAAVSDEEWEALGYNTTAAIHCDIVATSDRTITATMRDGSTQVIYADGKFQLD